MRRGIIEMENIISVILWIVFLILAGGAVYILIQRLTG